MHTGGNATHVCDGVWDVGHRCVYRRVLARGVHGAAQCSVVERTVREAMYGGVFARENEHTVIEANYMESLARGVDALPRYRSLG